MDDFNFKTSHIPPFGSWDSSDDLPFTRCFESARQAGLHRHSSSEDRDLDIDGDMYQNDVVTPAIIVLPRRRAKARYPQVKEAKKEAWVVCNCDYDVKEPPSPVPESPASKTVEEDLYRISPELLHAKPRKRLWGFFSSCLMPTCLHLTEAHRTTYLPGK
ncbi:unnamed protein product [Ilex paraguariensis]|uniref:RIN4 pathogenic type III effector avirulence factor Avr cleavage site domain-containing protein n=1 Tax=Ilex paraguariensis TaxID=185542 RepID=A0ABC8V5H3_9AQUA